MADKKRIAIYDNMKFVLIFLVVLGHFADLYTEESMNMRRIFVFIYFFHMPAFIFIGGLFSKKSIQEKNYRKVFEYFVLYIFIKVFLWIMEIISAGEIRELSLLSETGVPWFAFAFSVFFLLSIILQNVSPKYLFLFTIMLACFAGYDNAVAEQFVLSRIIVYYPFFLAGFYLDPYKIVTYLKQRHIKLISVIAFIVFMVVVYEKIDEIYWIRPLLTGQNPFVRLGNYYRFGGILRAGYYIIVFGMIAAIISLMPEKRGLVSKWGRRSNQVYALHYGFIYLFIYCGPLKGEKVLNKLFLGSRIWIIPLSVFVTILFSLKIWEKVLNIFLKVKWMERIK